MLEAIDSLERLLCVIEAAASLKKCYSIRKPHLIPFNHTSSRHRDKPEHRDVPGLQLRPVALPRYRYRVSVIGPMGMVAPVKQPNENRS